jgi:membrane-bound serine protease (ClpP class)
MLRVLGFVSLILLALSGTPAQEPATDAAPAVETETAPVEAPPADPAAPTVPDWAAESTATPVHEVTGEPFVVICRIEEEIDEGVAVVVERAVRESKNASALLFVINTPGGRVDSAIDIATSIMSVECPTIAYIEGMGAISAGALISYACDFIYMAEGSNIGASTPIMLGAETTPEMDEKSNSFVRAKYRALGEANGHDPILGEAMVDRNMEVRAYRNPDGTYHIFEVDAAKTDSSRSTSKDALDVILDTISEGNGEGAEDIKRMLRDVLGVPQPGTETESPADKGGELAEYRELLNANTELVSTRGELLTMTSKEAVHFGLAESITTDIDDTLREHMLGSVDRLEIIPTWEEALFAFLTSPTIAGLLLMAGLGGIYVEVRTPGFGAPGIVGAACLALFFGSHMVIGMTDWIDMALVAAGFLLILAEIFLLPGFGIAGVLGFACLIGGSYLALVDAPRPEFSWDFEASYQALYTLCVGMFSFIAFVVISGFVLPYTPIGGVMILKEALNTEAGYTAQTEEETRAALGLRGVAATKLRPAGKGRFGDLKLDVVTRGEFLDEGTPIEIISSDGNRHVVSETEAPLEGWRSE